MDDNARLIDTSDGSHSIYLPNLNETYHSSHGAITESKHVFLKHGLDLFKDKNEEVSVFEVGFGTGLNTLLTYQWAQQNNCTVNYHSIEKYPLEKSIWEKLNYGKLLNDEETFLQLHAVAWDTAVAVSDFFTITKIKAAWTDCPLQVASFNIIFYDAFAPNKQPEMWGTELLSKCYKSLKPGGVLVTYCAQGQFKRDLKAAGFEVETLDGPPGKKEMVRGGK